MYTGLTARDTLWLATMRRVCAPIRIKSYTFYKFSPLDCKDEIDISLEWCKLLLNFEYDIITYSRKDYRHHKIICRLCEQATTVPRIIPFTIDAADLLAIHRPDCWHSLRPSPGLSLVDQWPAVAEYLENPLDVRHTSAQGWPMACPPASPRPPMSSAALRTLQARVIHEAKLCR
jgi:hypothetical protein